jgi:hypothetical protein
MESSITTKHAPISIRIKVKTLSPIKLHIVVSDASNPKRQFTNRYNTVKGEETFVIRMPLSSEKALVQVYSDRLGKTASVDKEKALFEVISIDKIPLERRLEVSDMGNPLMRSFVRFAQKFSYMVQELDPNLYGSDDERYFIRLLPVIKSRDGKKLRTPARIGAKTGIIEVSKEAFDNMTVPMRFAILMHEFSHFYLNDEMKDEMEADLNGLLIYLGLGYPRIEAYQAFLETFTKSPSPLNKQRYDLINKFIEDFESMNMVIK